MAENNEVNENLIEVTDEETGEKIVFEILDNIAYEGNVYYVLTEYSEEEAEESDVYIMQSIDEDGEETLELVEDDDIVNDVFNIFKDTNADEFDFSE